MSSINGIFAYHYAANPVDPAELGRFDSSGDCGVWAAECGHLALQQRGPQPFISPDGRSAAILDGNLANASQLRQALERKGSKLQTDSDAEILLHLYAEKGEDLAADLPGSFAFAIWDADQRTLLLARSADGCKPLYYADDGWSFRFAPRKEALTPNGAAAQQVCAVAAGQAIVTDALGPRKPVRFSPTPPSVTTSQRALRVLALLTDGFGGHGGIAQYNRDLLTALAATNSISEIVVLPRCPDVYARELPQRIRQYPAVFSRTRYAAAAARLAVTAGAFDLVFCGHLFMAPLGAAIAKVLRIPMWLQLHGVDAWDTPGALVRLGAAQSTLVTAVSRYTRQRFLEWANLPPSSVRILPNTFEARFSAGAKPQHFLHQHGIQGKKVLLTVARLWASDQFKGQDRVIRVLPRLLAEGNDVVYVIVGDGDDLPRLQAEVNKAGVAERVIFAGRVSEADLPDYYRAADVFVMPSTGEGFGIAFLEAASAGLAVIGGNCDGSMDALADGAIGMPADPHDPQALAAAISECLNGKRPLRATGLDRFSRQNFADHATALLHSFRTTSAQSPTPGEHIGTRSAAFRTP
jgi:phosphatidylinositol alpha-1,6-mannosyltransferase